VIKVYGDLRSGNCYKVKLLMHLLDIEHQWIHVDILNKETHTAAFKAINPNAKIPTLVTESGESLWESNAILNYLADGTAFIPSKKFVRSQVLQWQFFEQYSHEPYVAVARYIKLYLDLPKDREAEHASKVAGLVADMYSIADISLYAYTHVAHEGGFDLSQYPGIQAWIERIESKLKHRTMYDFIEREKKSVTNNKSIHNLSVSDISGDTLDLSQFKGEVLLLVNVASECGLTTQYKGLQLLHDENRKAGFSVIGFPCNQFGAQEPGNEQEIQQFCETSYAVTFPLSSKVEVNGEGRHPIYEFLAGNAAAYPGDITWNFEKFLIDRQGRVIKRFSPDTEPYAEELIQELTAALKN